jgi:Ca2+-binding RTX toxin-like protein
VAFVCLLVLGLAPRASASGSGFFSPTGSMSVPREGVAAAPLPDGRVLVAGGRNYDDGRHYLSSAEVFDPATGTFSSAGIGSMSVPRYGAAAAPLPDGRVLVTGGYYLDSGDGSKHYLSSAEIFDPATGTFSSAGVGSMITARLLPAAAPLPDGRVLVAGGAGSDGSAASAEVFDPTTNLFSFVSWMIVDRRGPAAAPLPDGRVLVAGGFGIASLSNSEIFNPATDEFSFGTSFMSTHRDGAAAAPLPDGRVLVAGGYDSYGEDVGRRDYLSRAEVFNSATNTFSRAGIGPLSVPRWGAAAAPLPDGRVLVAGGFDGGRALSSAEIFAPISCRGKEATIIGTEGADQITGSHLADVIIGLGGDDRVSGLRGNDVICGGTGNDTLEGRVGNDQLYGQEGDDKLYGWRGKDKLYGQQGNDTLKGGPGKDVLKGGAGKDQQVGGL